MFVMRFGRKIAINLKSGSPDYGVLDSWKFFETVVSIRSNLHKLNTPEQGSVRDTLGAISDLDFLQKCIPILMHELDVPFSISYLSDKRDLLDNIPDGTPEHIFGKL